MIKAHLNSPHFSGDSLEETSGISQNIPSIQLHSVPDIIKKISLSGGKPPTHFKIKANLNKYEKQFANEKRIQAEITPLMDSASYHLPEAAKFFGELLYCTPSAHIATSLLL